MTTTTQATVANAAYGPPSYVSLAFRDIPQPDFAETEAIPLPTGATTDPVEWAQAIFDISRTPAWVRGLMGLRQALVGLLGIQRAGKDIFDVDSVQGEEALIIADAGHLDFRAAVGVDTHAGLVRLTTTVRLNGLAGRIYFLPVRIVHSPISFSMMRRAAKRLTP